MRIAMLRGIALNNQIQRITLCNSLNFEQNNGSFLSAVCI